MTTDCPRDLMFPKSIPPYLTLPSYRQGLDAVAMLKNFQKTLVKENPLQHDIFDQARRSIRHLAFLNPAFGHLLVCLQSPNANTDRHPAVLLGVKSGTHIDHARRFLPYKLDEAGDYHGPSFRWRVRDLPGFQDGVIERIHG